MNSTDNLRDRAFDQNEPGLPRAADTSPRAGPGSHLTLHYRLRLASHDADVISTFGGKPATLQLGIGQLAEPLERCLIGLSDGDKRCFRLSEGEAFGPRNPELIQRLARATFDAHTTPGTEYEPGDLVELPAPGGGRYAGVVKAINDQYVLFDFNHPLAGQALDFEVEILGVL
jgi:FKBP-type peptidyl-prolyl cis-trans isomerase SlpA